MYINLANIDFVPGQGGGGSAVIEGLTITSNGTYTAGEGVDGYSPIEVNVPISGWDQKSFTEGTIEIINVDNPASFVASSAFKNNKTIQTVNLPMCSYIGEDAFYGCISLSQVSLPVCEHIGGSVFIGCAPLSQVSLPVCEYIGSSVFRGCVSLSQVSLPMCSYIGGFAFWGCSSLSIITIGYSSVCSLGSSNVFNRTKITSSTGSIYVPTSLVDSYKSATNWLYFSTQIFPIE